MEVSTTKNKSNDHNTMMMNDLESNQNDDDKFSSLEDNCTTTTATDKGSPEKEMPTDNNSTDDDNDTKSNTSSSNNNNKTELPPMSVKPSFGQLLQTAKPEWCMLTFAVVLMMIAESTGLIIPLIIAKAYDTLVDESIDDKMADINYYMILSLIVFGGGTIAGFFRATILGVIGERMVARLRLQLYQSVLNQEIAFFDEHKSGELVSRLGSDTTLLQQVISQSLPEAFLGILKVIVSIALMFYISLQLAGVAIGSVVLVFMVAFPLGTYLGILSKSYQDVLGQAQTHSTEAFGSMRTVQSFAAGDKEMVRFTKRIGNPDDFPWWWPATTSTTKKTTTTTTATNTATSGGADGYEAETAPLIEKSTYRVGFFKALVTASFFVFVFGAGFGFLYVSMWYGFYLVNQGEMSLGDLTAFQSYVFTIGFGLGAASSHLARVFEGLGASGRIFYLLERIPSIPDPNQDQSTTLKPTSMEGHVEFHNVSFAYPSRSQLNVLNGYSLKIPANTTTALVGSSGAGKSTVVSLLQRFYDVNGGSITVDGNDIRDLNLQWFRRHIGYVQQEPQLFGLSVRENLLYGVPDYDYCTGDGSDDNAKITQEEIEQACRDANAHDFIMSWPNGYDTLVGERGVKLSGGQKQRVAIARALLTKCRILLLDEATSALDAESEHLVQEAIDNVVVGRTVIIVAHRLSTIQRADQIVVMDDHKIVDVGTHDKLLSNCTKYQDLIKRQSMIARDVSVRGLMPEGTEKEEEEEC